MTVRADKSTIMYIKVETGEDKYAKRSFRNVNPALSDDNMLHFGNKLGELQTHTVDSVIRRDECTLMAE